MRARSNHAQLQRRLSVPKRIGGVSLCLEVVGKITKRGETVGGGRSTTRIFTSLVS